MLDNIRKRMHYLNKNKKFLMKKDNKKWIKLSYKYMNKHYNICKGYWDTFNGIDSWELKESYTILNDTIRYLEMLLERLK